MRWVWVDRILEIERGAYVKTLKNISLAEEQLHDHHPHFAVMPGSLILEGMAQTGGLLLGSVNDFKKTVVLAKVPKITFHSWAVPGDQIIYEGKLTNVRPEGGSVDLTATIGDRRLAEAEIVFSHLDDGLGPACGDNGKAFCFNIKTLYALEIARTGVRRNDPVPPGIPLLGPDYLQEQMEGLLSYGH